MKLYIIIKEIQYFDSIFYLYALVRYLRTIQYITNYQNQILYYFPNIPKKTKYATIMNRNSYTFNWKIVNNYFYQ